MPPDVDAQSILGEILRLPNFRPTAARLYRRRSKRIMAGDSKASHIQAPHIQAHGIEAPHFKAAFLGRLRPAQTPAEIAADITPQEAEEAEEARHLARARRGDQDSIGWLVARYRERAVRLAARILRRPDEAEDAAQEAFLRAFRSLHTFRGEGRFYTWLYHIIVRVCLDRQRVRRWDAEETLDMDALCRDAAHYVEASVEKQVENHVLVEMLLDRLSPPMRAMLVLRELEGLEYEEIARIVDIPVGRVKWRLHQARAQFRALWEAVTQEVDHV